MEFNKIGLVTLYIKVYKLMLINNIFSLYLITIIIIIIILFI